MCNMAQFGHFFYLDSRSKIELDLSRSTYIYSLIRLDEANTMVPILLLYI